jgi:hypothetical protein
MDSLLDKPKKPPILEFITFSGDPEDEAKSSAIRTQVKKHVMKDIGRSRRRPKKNEIFEVLIDPRSVLGTGDVDPFAPYPIEMGATERELVTYSEYFFRPNICELVEEHIFQKG